MTDPGRRSASRGAGGLDPATRVVQLGRPARVPGGPVNPPVQLSSLYHQGGDVAYARDSIPTWEAFEEAVGALEGGHAVAFASGMAAIAAVIESTAVGVRVVADRGSYQGFRQFLADLGERGRVSLRTVDLTDTAATLAACEEALTVPSRSGRAPATGEADERLAAQPLLWLESPTNPLLGVADLPALIEGAHRLGMTVALDNTFATPLRQQPLALGADVVVHSATKLLAGHSDVVLGVAVAADRSVRDALAQRRLLHGAVPGPFETWLALRGLRTLAVRLDRAEANAAELAGRLSGRAGVTVVRYPGLPEHPGHSRAKAQMSGFGTMVSFDVAGGAKTADEVAAATKLIVTGTSLGGVETLLERRGRWPGESSLPPGLLRLSVGVEAVEDLWHDLDQALATAGLL